MVPVNPSSSLSFILLLRVDNVLVSVIYVEHLVIM